MKRAEEEESGFHAECGGDVLPKCWVEMRRACSGSHCHSLGVFMLDPSCATAEDNHLAEGYAVQKKHIVSCLQLMPSRWLRKKGIVGRFVF